MTDSVLFIEKQNPFVKVCVVVPVKDEGKELENTLDALYYQVDASGKRLNMQLYEVLLLANNCTDNSYQIANEYRLRHPRFNLYVADIQLDSEVAHIGTARRLLMDEAYSRFADHKKHKGIIASTDGDSEVDKQWIFSIISAMGDGIDAVGGRIISRKTPKQSRLPHLQDVSYRYYASKLETIINPCAHDPWPRHFQCYGPSLAVTCEVYIRAGRMPVLSFLEDEEFRKSLYRIDAKVRMCPNVKVYTSSRLVGKVQFGFSIQLQRWAEMFASGECVKVETLPALIEKYELKHLLKNFWQSPLPQGSIEHIAKRLFVNSAWLKEEVRSSGFFGTLWEKVEMHLLENGTWQNHYPPEPINKVIPELRDYLYNNKSIRNLHKLKEIA